MSNFKAGFIGCGNMGFALASAASKVVGGEKIIISDKNYDFAKERAAALSAHFGTPLDVCEKAEFIFLGVKPQNLDEIAKEIKETTESRKDNFIIVSMLAGVSVDTLGEKISDKVKIIRIMPNTPVSVGEGMVLMSGNELVTEEDKAEFLRIMEKSGTIDEIPEKLIDAGTAISGCGPAFCYMFMDALADGGVACGLPKEKALLYAMKTLLGSSSLALSSEESPSVLKDRVTSPGGSTIEGVKALEEGAFRASLINAAVASFEKTKKLGK